MMFVLKLAASILGIN